MKQWTNPQIYTLNLKDTKSHFCHKDNNYCPDFSGEHESSGHTKPDWIDSHGHTCCCSS